MLCASPPPCRPRGQTPAGTTRRPCCSSRRIKCAYPGWTYRSHRYPGSRKQCAYPPAPGLFLPHCIRRRCTGPVSVPGAKCALIFYPMYTLPLCIISYILPPIARIGKHKFPYRAASRPRHAHQQKSRPMPQPQNHAQGYQGQKHRQGHRPARLVRQKGVR